MAQSEPQKVSRRQPHEVEIDEYVGGRIHERRKLLGLSQSVLAGGLGITFQQLQKYETGANRISAGKLYQCAKILDIEIEFFFSGISPNGVKKPKGKKAADDSMMGADETLKLVRGYYLIPGEMRQRIRDLIGAAAAS